MFYDREQTAAHLQEWAVQLEKASLPEWDALPDLPLYMDQVLLLLGQYLNTDKRDDRAITASIVNNYVRMKVMPPPVKKKYTRLHLAYLIMICTLKQSLSISCIQKLLPADIPQEQLRSLYNDFTARHREVCCYFREQMKNSAPPLFHGADSAADPIGAMAVGAAMVANLCQELTDQIVALPRNGQAPET